MQLNLDDVLKNMDELKHKYEIKTVMCHKNRFGVELQAIRPKDLTVHGGRLSNDKLLNMLVKEEELLNKLEDIKKSYDLYRDMAINILVEYAMTKPVEEMIVIYRDTMSFKWNDIAWLVKYSRAQVIRIYEKAKNETL